MIQLDLSTREQRNEFLGYLFVCIMVVAIFVAVGSAAIDLARMVSHVLGI